MLVGGLLVRIVPAVLVCVLLRIKVVIVLLGVVVIGVLLRAVVAVSVLLWVVVGILLGVVVAVGVLLRIWLWCRRRCRTCSLRTKLTQLPLVAIIKSYRGLERCLALAISDSHCTGSVNTDCIIHHRITSILYP